jgi:DNA-binding MarR family transcriptional regulator
MEAMNFLARDRSENDERKVIITLTQEGKALKEKLLRVPLSLCESYPCHAQGIQTLRENLMSLLNALQV